MRPSWRHGTPSNIQWSSCEGNSWSNLCTSFLGFLDGLSELGCALYMNIRTSHESLKIVYTYGETRFPWSTIWCPLTLGQNLTHREAKSMSNHLSRYICFAHALFQLIWGSCNLSMVSLRLLLFRIVPCLRWLWFCRASWCQFSVRDTSFFPPK